MAKRTVEHKTAIRNSVGRIAIFGLFVLVQIAAFIVLVVLLGNKFPPLDILMRAIAIIIALGINSRDHNGVFKLIWVIVILVLPIPGLLFYVLNNYSSSKHKIKKRLDKVDLMVFSHLNHNDVIFAEFKQEDPARASNARYLRSFNFPIYEGTSIKYFPVAYDSYKAQIEDIKKAKKFVYLEYHAIENKDAFEPLHEALKERAAAGVDCRVLYDDVGSFLFINRNFVKLLESEGINCNAFNPAYPFLSLFMNNRDHRKITVIDGKVGYTGGYNIADEYFNMVNPYGHWKDNGIRLEGPAVQSLTAMFVEMWNFADIKRKDDDLMTFEPMVIEPVAGSSGYCVPYCDSPLDLEPIGENVYLNMINNAQEFCWFMSPYLVLSDELARALQIAAKRGVDVRIMTPGIPDKKLTYNVTRSYYNMLVTSGVRIYEYTPGFNHSKTCLCDDKCAVVGTINLDFRSLYHHFENAVYMYRADCIPDIKQDFIDTIAECRDVTEKYSKRPNIFVRFFKSILRLIAPLL
ncbi:cardiolipin synthase [Butyrivibrio sp. AE2032]|uniref:cardiolipin synthase n=1 Tax=Butyrivibrio sp. AE2032 TaxID=1458463 RepID=UPI0005578820|nr:cardiolipin synthase [Butyrivibrio sp. AE2032]